MNLTNNSTILIPMTNYLLRYIVVIYSIYVVIHLAQGKATFPQSKKQAWNIEIGAEKSYMQ